jgi:NTE family protein
MENKKSIALVLGGGGARGLAHIGVLKVLKEFEIPISAVFGCSMGGLIASLFANGTDTAEMENIARKYTSVREMIKLVDLTPHRRGIIISQRLRSYFSQFIDADLKMEDSQIPLFMNSVDLNTGKEIVLDRGNLLDAIISTTAVPGLFSPIEFPDNVLLADGGVVNNLPVSSMRKITNSPIVAVDVHHSFPIPSSQHNKSFISASSVIPEFFRDFYRAEMIMVRRIMDIQIAESPADLLLQPAVDPDINMFLGFQRAPELISAGEQSARNNIHKILKLIGKSIS